VIKSRGVKWAGHAKPKEEMRKANQISVAKLELKKPVEQVICKIR
jgi:hypothetical protein